MSHHRLTQFGFVLSLVALLLIGLTSCTKDKAHKSFEAAKPALQYLSKTASNGSFSFSAGPYKGGTAVLGSGNEAFWVKDGKPYVVNEEAKKIAPDLEQAPSDIQFNDEFKKAAEVEN